MANEQYIDQVVTPEAEAGVQRLKAELSDLNQQFIDTAKGVAQMQAALGGSQSLRQFNDNANKAAQASERLAQAQARTAQAQNNLQKSAIALQQAQDRQAATQQRAMQATQRALSPYEQLNARYRQLTATARDAGIAFGKNSEQFRTAAAEANAVRAQLDGVDNVLGHSQRNVGNYASAFSKLYGYIRTAANILPGVGISGIFLAGFEGIKYVVEQSGLLAEKIDQTKKNQEALNEVNKNADLQAGTQLTNLKYLYAAATDVNNSTKDRKLAVNELQKEFPNYFKNISDETILNGGAKKSYDDLSVSILGNARAVAAANKIAELQSKILDTDIQKQKIRIANSNEISDINKQIAAGKFDVTTGTGEAGGSDVLAQQTIDKSNKRAKDAIKQQDELQKSYQATIQVIQSAAGGATKIGNALAGNKDNTDKPKGKSAKELLDEQLKAYKLANDTIQADENKSYAERYQAAYDYERKSEDAIIKAENKKVVTVVEASNRATQVEKDANADRKKIQEQINKEYEKLQAELYKNLKAGEAARLLEIKNAQNERLQIIEKERSDYLTELNKQYTAGVITTTQYNQKVLAIEQATTQKRIEVNLAAAKEALNTEIGAAVNGFADPKDIQKAADDLVKIQKEADDYITKVQLDNIDKLKQARQDLATIERDTIYKTADAIQSLIDNGYRQQYEALQDQSNQVEKNADTERSAIENSLDTASNKAAKQKVLDAQVTANKEQLAQREKAIQKEQARIDAIVAEAKIIGTTAQTILALEATAAQATAQGALLLSNPLTAAYAPIAFAAAATITAEIPFIIAQAAVQAIATAVPAFATGVKGFSGGAAVVGERGSELLDIPGSGTFLSPPTATLLNLPKGTDVYTATQTRNMVRPEVLSFHDGKSVVSVNLDPLLKATKENKPIKQYRTDWRNTERAKQFAAYKERRFK